MSGSINYKLKYQQLKSQFMDSIDVAFRLGYEQGAQQATIDSNQQQMQQQQAQAQLGQQPGQPGQDQSVGQFSNNQKGSSAGAEQMGNPNAASTHSAQPDSLQESENPAGSELDQHIAELEGMLKSEDATVAGLLEITSKIKNLRQSMELKKSSMAISAISQALHKPAFNLGVQASHNLSDSSKAAVNMQEKIVSDIMAQWDEESNKTSKDISDILNLAGFKKD